LRLVEILGDYGATIGVKKNCCLTYDEKQQYLQCLQVLDELFALIFAEASAVFMTSVRVAEERYSVPVLDKEFVESGTIGQVAYSDRVKCADADVERFRTLGSGTEQGVQIGYGPVVKVRRRSPNPIQRACFIFRLGDGVASGEHCGFSVEI